MDFFTDHQAAPTPPPKKKQEIFGKFVQNIFFTFHSIIYKAMGEEGSLATKWSFFQEVWTLNMYSQKKEGLIVGSS